MATFPLRVVFMRMEKKEGKEKGMMERTNAGKEDVPPVSILVSVPKKRFRHAVDRNRMKRLVKEAYRTNKHVLWNTLEGKDYRLAVAFVCITDELPSFYSVNKSMKKALARIADKLNQETS